MELRSCTANFKTFNQNQNMHLEKDFFPQQKLELLHLEAHPTSIKYASFPLQFLLC